MERAGAASAACTRLSRLFAAYLLGLHWLCCGFWRLATTPVRRAATKSEWYQRRAEILPVGPGVERRRKSSKPVLVSRRRYDLDGDEALKTAPLGHRWLYGVTRVLALLLGEDTEPRSAAECAFAASTITFGVFGLAVVVGQVTLAAQQLDALGRKRTEQVDAVLLYLRYRDVPADVRREIVRFIDYMWQSGQAEHDTAGLEALPDSLKLRLDLALKQRLIAKVPLFEDLPVTGVVAVVRALRALVAIPGEVVVHEGHEGARRRGDPRRPRLRGARPWAARTRVRRPP